MSTTSSTPRDSLASVLALAAGLSLTLGALFVSGFNDIPGDLGDTRLVNFSLEHAHGFVVQRAPHRSLWDPPIFYPVRNVAAYTDLTWSFVPFYSPWRILGLPPDTAFQLWLIVVWSANFMLFYFFLRHAFGVGPLAASAGAFLFAFGSPRVTNVAHPQLVPHLYVAAALYALDRVFKAEASGDRRRLRGWIAAFFAALVLQLYGAFYPFFFTVLLVALAAVCALVFQDSRRRLGRLLRDAWGPLLAAFLVAALAAMPLVERYLVTARVLGEREWASTTDLIPRWPSWFLMGRDNRLYGWIQDSEWLLDRGAFFHRSPHSNGLGIVTPALVVLGLIGRRRLPAVRVLAATFILAGLVTTLWGGFTFWRFFHDHLPGASAIRALGRLGMMTLIPAGIGLALFVDRWKLSAKRPLLAAAGLLVALEQAHDVPRFDKLDARRRVAAVIDGLEPPCRAFYVGSTGRRRMPYVHEDAMWAASLSGVPTLNGRYGNAPHDWFLADTHLKFRPGLRRYQIEIALADWTEHNCLDAETVCWIELTTSGRGRNRTRRVATRREHPSPCTGS